MNVSQAAMEFTEYLERIKALHGKKGVSKQLIGALERRQNVIDFIRNASDTDVEQLRREIRGHVDAGSLRGVLSEVALLKALTTLGYSPRQSSPSEDLHLGIDLWLSPSIALQVKGVNAELLSVLAATPPCNELPSMFNTLVTDQTTKAEHRNRTILRKVANLSEKLAQFDPSLSGYVVILPAILIHPYRAEFPDQTVRELGIQLSNVVSLPQH